jgi:hypothetical protein
MAHEANNSRQKWNIVYGRLSPGDVRQLEHSPGNFARTSLKTWNQLPTSNRINLAVMYINHCLKDLIRSDFHWASSLFISPY